MCRVPQRTGGSGSLSHPRSGDHVAAAAPSPRSRYGSARVRNGRTCRMTIFRPVVAVAVLGMLLDGCTVSRDIVLRDANGREAVCDGVTGLYGLRSHTLLSVQRRCVE